MRHVDMLAHREKATVQEPIGNAPTSNSPTPVGAKFHTLTHLEKAAIEKLIDNVYEFHPAPVAGKKEAKEKIAERYKSDKFVESLDLPLLVKWFRHQNPHVARFLERNQQNSSASHSRPAFADHRG